MSEGPAGLSEIFWAGLVATGAGVIGVGLKYAYKSKCKEINLCCISVKRDIDAEAQEDLKEMESGTKSEPLAVPSTPTIPLPPPVRTAAGGRK